MVKDILEELKKEDIKKATKELSEGAGIESLTGKFIFDEEQLVENVIFTSHKMKDAFCFGFLLPKEVPITNRRGKTIGREQIMAPAILTSDKKLLEPTSEMENSYKIRYIAIPNELDLRIQLGVIEKFIKKENILVEGKELFNSVKQAYEKFLFFQNPLWYEVHALWDMGTYFFQLFHSYPLLDLSGLASTGKSKIMNVSRIFTLNPTQIMINPSEASLFRLTHSNRPTKYIDECEKLFQFVAGTWQSSPVVELINGSYSKGSSVPRLEKVGNNYRLVNFGCYSPTMLGSIAGLRGATETRAITHITTKAPDNDKRGEIEVEDFLNAEEYKSLRSNLFIFALENWKSVEETYRGLKLDNLKKRDFQLWKPLLSIAKVINEDLFQRVLVFAEKISEQKRQDFIPEGSVDYRLLEKLKEFLYEQDKNKIYIREISVEINKTTNEKEKVTERSISAHLDKLGFKEFRTRDRAGSFVKIDRSSYETIVAPTCPNLLNSSSQPSQPIQLNEKQIKIGDGYTMVSDGDSSLLDKKRDDCVGL